MKITQEQFEEVLTVGEAKAAQMDKMFSIRMNRTEVNQEETEENGEKEITKYLGFIFEFRPQVEEVSHGFSTRTMHESEIFDYWETSSDGKEWYEEKGFGLGFYEFIDSWKAPEIDLIIVYNKQKYASWEPFAKAFGITELVTISTKIPKALSIKLQKICEEEGETPSWRTRLLIQEYLTERIKERVRRVMFEE